VNRRPVDVPVTVRAMQVDGKYENSAKVAAKRLDHHHHSSNYGPVLAVTVLSGYPALPTITGPPGGSLGEACSSDVHAVLELAAMKKAESARDCIQEDAKEMGSR
jgi:hypothetical protein